MDKLLKKNPWTVYLLLLVVFFCWGSIYVATKYLSTGMPAGFIACARTFIAAFPLCFMARGCFKIKVEKSDWKYFIIVGGVGYYFTFLINQMGVARAGASLSALLNTVNPVTISILAAIILKEPIRKIQLLCLALALAGAYVVLAGAETDGQLVGLVMVLISVLSWGVASVYMRFLTAKYPAVMVTCYGMLISLVFHIPTAAVQVAQAGGVRLTAQNVMILLYLGVVASAVAQFFWTKSLSILPATTCSLFYPLQPVFSAVLGAAVLGETFGANFYLGLLLIGGDIILNCIDGMKQQKKSAAAK